MAWDDEFPCSPLTFHWELLPVPLTLSFVREISPGEHSVACEYITQPDVRDESGEGEKSTMNTLWNTVGLVCVCIGFFLVMSSLFTLLRRWMRKQQAFARSGEQVVIERNTSVSDTIKLLCNGFFLMIGPVGIDLVHKDASVGFFWGAASLFGYSLFRFFCTISEYFAQKVAKEGIERNAFFVHFQRELAIAAFFLGLSVTVLSSGFAATNIPLLQAISRVRWLSDSFLLVSGLYWVLAPVLWKPRARAVDSR